MNKIFFVGLGKLGLIFSYIFAEYGYKIYGFDKNLKIKKNIKENIKSCEPKLNYLINKYKNRFTFCEDIKKSIIETMACFVILPTPSKKNHIFDNSYILNFLKSIGPFLKNKKHYLINITSTVNPGSCEFFIKFLETKYNLTHGKEFIITYNPHLIALGSIYNNVLNSDFVIVGSNIKTGHNILKKIYKKIYKNCINKLKFLSLKEAEISKIAVNSYITMKISFSNTISQIADSEKNIDVSRILETIGCDKRIGNKYLSLGGSYAGPCFPRDNLNIIEYLKKIKVSTCIPKAVEKVNNTQTKRYVSFFNKYKNFLDKKIKIGICGINYKENTQLTTKSPGENLFKYFKKNYQIIIYDEFKPELKYRSYFTNDLDTFLKKSNFIFICYKNIKFKKIEKLKTNNKKVVVDLWNQVNFTRKNILLKKIGIS